MKVVELLEQRRTSWKALEALCAQMESRRRRRSAESVSRFAALYRSACADLALADAYQLPPATVQYLHQLVARAHNQFYRGRMFNFSAWRREMFMHVPQRLFADRCFWLAMTLFWGFLVISMLAAYGSPDYIATVLSDEMRQQFDSMYSQRLACRSGSADSAMLGFYIWNNIGIALQCFAGGLLLGVGGLLATVFNAVFIGAVFGYMAQGPHWPNFREFATAHGPFELTAIVMAAAAGMRLGFSLVETHGLARVESLQLAARQAMPAMGGAMVLLFFAAIIEGFVSPSALPYGVKLFVGAASAAMLLAYIIGLGIPRRTRHAAR